MYGFQASSDPLNYKRRRLEEPDPYVTQRPTKHARKPQTQSQPGVNFEYELTATVSAESQNKSVMTRVPSLKWHPSPSVEPQHNPVEVLATISIDDGFHWDSEADGLEDRLEAMNLGQRESLLLQLPGELRNMIYEAACCKEFHFGGERHGFEHHDGINLLKTNRQIHREMKRLQYALLELHVHDWWIFIDWLLHRTLPQLKAITTLYIHITTFHDVLDPNIDFSNGESSYNVHPHTFKTWPNLPSLQTAHVYIHPYYPMCKSHSTSLGFASDGILWEHRASQIARIYKDQVRLLSGNDVQFIGHWSYPISSEILDMRKICWDNNTLYKNTGGYWTCVVPECRALWKPQHMMFKSRADSGGQSAFHTKFTPLWATLEFVAD
jgi:hypothetical protein